MEFPAELHYTAEHEWLRVAGDGTRTAVVGITDFAQDQLGDVVYVELPLDGDDVFAGEPFGVVESVKTVSDLYAPVDGKVVAVNDALETEPERVNDDPYGAGWLIRIEIHDTSQVDELLSVDAYRQQIGG